MTYAVPDTLFARTVLGAAAEVEQAETKLKAAVLHAASAGDWPVVIDIMTRWLNEPSVTVAGSLPDFHTPPRIDLPLDPCGQPEVGVRGGGVHRPAGGSSAAPAAKENPPCA